MSSDAHHLRIGAEHLRGNGGLGRYVLLPGDPSRARTIAEHFDERRTVENPRGHEIELGTVSSSGGGAVEVMVVATGIGGASVEVVVSELLECGARRLMRVGSCGTMVPEIRPGQLVIATGAVRDEMTSRHYAPLEYPAIAHPDGIRALVEAATLCDLADNTFLGICHSKASLYGREFGRGPAGDANLDYTAWLRRSGVIATEMETSALFTLAATHQARATAISSAAGAGCRAAAIFGVFGTDDCNMAFDPAVAMLAEERTIRVALTAIGAWARIDRIIPRPTGRHDSQSTIGSAASDRPLESDR